MSYSSILVTGADGFVGSHLMPSLKQTFPAAALHALASDVTDRAAIDAEIRAVRPEACVHLAAIAAIPDAGRDTNKAWQVNLHGTLNLAQAILASAKDCRFLFISSADAYGATFRTGRAITETCPLAPLNTYSSTKAAADLAIGALANEGLNAIRLRPFNHTGSGQSDAFVVASFARQIARIAAGKQEPVLNVGALGPSRDFLDVRDVCAAYAACLLKAAEIPIGTILNIASGKPRQIGDVLQQLLEIAGVTVRVDVDASRLRASEIPFAYGDPAKAEALLDWKPRIAWEQTLKDVFDYWRDRVASEQK